MTRTIVNRLVDKREELEASLQTLLAEHNAVKSKIGHTHDQLELIIEVLGSEEDEQERIPRSEEDEQERIPQVSAKHIRSESETKEAKANPRLLAKETRHTGMRLSRREIILEVLSLKPDQWLNAREIIEEAMKVGLIERMKAQGGSVFIDKYRAALNHMLKRETSKIQSQKVKGSPITYCIIEPVETT